MTCIIVMMSKINTTVLMSGAQYFGDQDAINDLMDAKVPVDVEAAVAEHGAIKRALELAGVTVRQVSAPRDCQDGVYAANWGLVRHGRILMSRLPNKRKPEEAYALEAVKNLGLEALVLPANVQRFSGQGDALPCGDIVFTQSPYRTTTDAHPYLKQWLGFREVIALETKPARSFFGFGPPRKNKLTGWPDSPTYDIDLALAVLKAPTPQSKGLIAYCPAVFKKASREFLKNYNDVDKIEVSHHEALHNFALNLVSTGEVVVMPAGATNFQNELEKYGLTAVPLKLTELRKGGGAIRCSTLTLEN